MNHATDRGYVHGAMQSLPTLTTEATDPAFGGCDGWWNQQNKSSETHGDVPALLHILPHAGEIKGLVGPDVRKEVQADIEKSEEAEHAAKTYQLRQIQRFSQRRDSQRDD